MNLSDCAAGKKLKVIVGKSKVKEPDRVIKHTIDFEKSWT